MRHFKIALIFFLFLLPSSAYTEDVQEYRLKNGLKVLFIEDHKAPLATFQIWYMAGSKDEPFGKTGMSHLLEHMMFKGTGKYGPKEFSNIIQRNGGTDNAFTTKDYTMYFETLSSDRVGLSMELEADRMANLRLDPKEVSSEKNVVMEERRMRYEDDPQNSLEEEVIAAAFKVHPYQWPVIGWMSNISAIDREDLSTYYKKAYSPDNAFIVLSGDIKPDAAIAMIEKEFGSIPSAGKKPPPLTMAEPEQKGDKYVTLNKEAEVPCIMMAFHVPSFPHDDSFALDILATVLSAGKSSRLYRSLTYEKKLALNSYADYSGLHKYPFLFFVGAISAPGSNIEDIEKALYEEIEKIKNEQPSAMEVQKARNQIEASFVFAQDSNYSRAYYAGIFEMLGDWRLMDKYLEGIRKVKPEDVQAAARKYLTSNNRTVGILFPTKTGSIK